MEKKEKKPNENQTKQKHKSCVHRAGTFCVILKTKSR